MEELIDFPVKKYLVIVRNKILNEIKSKKNIFFFDFSNEIKFPISFNIIIDFKKSTIKEYSGFVDIHELKNLKYQNININILVHDNIKALDYDEIFSIINHELKHIYDYYKDRNRNTMEEIINLDDLIVKYDTNNELKYLLHLLYSASIHEMDAKCSMIYEKLRYLKTIDKSVMIKEFEKSYIFKELKSLNEFSYINFLKQVDKTILIEFTKELIIHFYKEDFDDYTNNEVIQFYKNAEIFFKHTYKKYLDKAYKIIEEIILDNTPYNENRYITSLNYNKIDKFEIQENINEIFDYLIHGKIKYIKTYSEFLLDDEIFNFY